ncbi:MAG: diaminopimelate decarboxylase [Rickettsiales bacterium]|nr:diaminopimelate decarboxylase [Rickettsiales bacterium]
MDHFAYQSGTLHAEGVSIAAIAQAVGTPFYCYSTATLLRHLAVFRDGLAALNPRICYAAKANSNRAVLATLAQAGAGCDVVSEGEIRLALASGMRADQIVFSGVGKTRAEMQYALSQAIFQFNVESLPELELLNAVAGDMGVRAPVALRVNPDVVPHTHAKISTGQKESKFGIAWNDARDFLRRADAMPHVHLRGVSVHIGSQLTSLEPFRLAFTRVRELVAEMRASGIDLRVIDLGGGLGIPYDTDAASPPLPTAYGTMVQEVFAGFDAEYVFEPGRLIVGNAGVLIAQVIYEKESAGRRFVIVDAAMNDLLRPSLYNAHHDIIPVIESQHIATPADIVGPVCETSDIFASGRLLPPLDCGDLVAFRSAGAYGAVMSGTYNARPLVPEVLVNGTNWAVVRERPAIETLLSRDQIPEWLVTKS